MQHSLNCAYPEGCECGASAHNLMANKIKHLEATIDEATEIMARSDALYREQGAENAHLKQVFVSMIKWLETQEKIYNDISERNENESRSSKYSQGRMHGYEHAREHLERLTAVKKSDTVTEKDKK